MNEIREMNSRVDASVAVAASELAVLEIGMALVDLQEQDRVVVADELDLGLSERGVEREVSRALDDLGSLAAEEVKLREGASVLALLVLRRLDIRRGVGGLLDALVGIRPQRRELGVQVADRERRAVAVVAHGCGARRV